MNTVAQSTQAIQDAVSDCLARCYGGTPPIAEIVKLSEELRSKGWDEADILTVEVTVRRVLSKVLDSNLFDDDAGPSLGG